VGAAAGAVALGILVPAVQAAATSGFQVHRTNLVADRSGFGAKLVDPNLTNAWGLASAPDGPLWVSDNNSGNASVYTGGVRGSAVVLQLTVSVPGGNPTGQVFNPTAGETGSSAAFRLGGATGTVSDFIVSSDSIGANQSPGEIAAWGGGSSFAVEDSPTGGAGGMTPAGAVFKGLAVSTAPKAGPELFAADVANATVDVFNSDFAPVATPTEFRDPAIPSDYAPFGIQALDGDIYVTYAKQNAMKTNVIPGTGWGYVDVYSPNGVLLHHLISGGAGSPLDEPWGLAIAPKSFGSLAGMLLVGNLGNGWINAFDPTTGTYIGPLTTGAGTPIVIRGLWGLEPGSAAFGGKGSIVFSAGPTKYSDGVLGVLSPR
jgi:uncharacterized protein (TIGR03118 family)